jgi:CheY-like chemotaxis protein
LIVRDLRSLSRGEETLVELVDLHPILDFAIGMSRSELRHRARLMKDYGPVPQVRANAAKLGQVFLNLLINAAQAIPPGRMELNEVRVSTATEPDGRARIEITDSGTGVSAEVASRLFDPFVTTKRLGEGTGLGLSICKAAITALGGEIGFEAAPDRGTIFRVLLPAAVTVEAEPPGQPVPAVAPPPRRGLVAVVDDEPGVCRAIERLLGGEQDVETFKNARELAERIAEGARFDAILCDLMMPDMTGMELHGVLERAAPALANGMIFMTGGTFTPEAQAFLGAVSNPRLEKPFETAALRALVRAQVEKAPLP